MKARSLLVTLLLISVTSAQAQGIRPLGSIEGELRWQELGNRTDNFDDSKLDNNKWINNPSDLVIGAWTFTASNAYLLDGKLNIKVTQETHTRPFQDVCQGGATAHRELYYKSGAVKSSNDGIYGYYEARMKGVAIFPGLSPAFWLYSDGHPYADRNIAGSVDYSEIDIVELQQADWFGPDADDADPINVMDHNLHTRVVDNNGNTFWRRPKDYPESQLLKFDAPFDPSHDFHTYAVENRRDIIRWYVDGELIGEKPNLYWHRPMHIIFSMGLRRQFIYYNSSCNRADPNPNSVANQGFPEDATMQVDYVKTWEVLPSIWVNDKGQHLNTDYHTDEMLPVVVSYHGGSQHYVANGPYNGLTVNLVEKNSNGFVKIAASASDNSVTAEDKRYGGKTNLQLRLTGVTPTAELPPGHYYALVPAFRSSSGSDIFQVGGIQPVNIVRDGGSSIAVCDVSQTPQSGSLYIGQTKALVSIVLPSCASNKNLTFSNSNPTVASVNSAGVVTAKNTGTALITVKTKNKGKTAGYSVTVIQ